MDERRGTGGRMTTSPVTILRPVYVPARIHSIAYRYVPRPAGPAVWVKPKR